MISRWLRFGVSLTAAMLLLVVLLAARGARAAQFIVSTNVGDAFNSIALTANGGWVVGRGDNFAWIASVTNGVALTASNWLALHFGLPVTNTLTASRDILVANGRLILAFDTPAGAALFTSDAAPSLPAPTLLIARWPSGEIELRWPTNRSCAVESTPLLPALDWTALSNAVPVLVNTQYSLSLPATNVATYFRLRCP